MKSRPSFLIPSNQFPILYPFLGSLLALSTAAILSFNASNHIKTLIPQKLLLPLEEDLYHVLLGEIWAFFISFFGVLPIDTIFSTDLSALAFLTLDLSITLYKGFKSSSSVLNFSSVLKYSFSPFVQFLLKFFIHFLSFLKAIFILARGR